MSSTPTHLFLCAVGRSGTTIFRTSFGAHPEVYYNQHENNIVQDLLAVGQSNCTQPSRQFAMVVEQDRYNQIFQHAINDLIWPDTEQRKRPVHMAAINPTGDQMDYLSQVYPSAHVLVLVRNGIEVVSSRMKFASFASQSFENHCKVWNRSQSVVRWGQNHPNRFRIIRHEWFYDANRLQQEMRQLYQWLKIADSDLPANQILDTLRHPTDPSSNATDFSQWSDKEKADYFRSKSLRWQQWSQTQRSQFESQCGEFMSDLGYPLPWKTD